jgi:TATA-box binding protein (TBP) (component of TFIID and TFIIIB)
MTQLSPAEAPVEDQNIHAAIHSFHNNASFETCRPFRLTTMTLIVTLFELQLDISSFLTWIEGVGGISEVFAKHDGEWTVKGGFLNCIIVSHKTTSRVAVKIFRNGKLHMTGVKTCEQALWYARIFCQVFDTYDPTKKTHVVHLQKQLMNGCVKIKMLGDNVINLKNLHEKLLDYTENMCIFNNDHHPGVRIKCVVEHPRHVVTIMIFESGSILLSSFLNARHLSQSYNFIADFLLSCLEQVTCQGTRHLPTAKKRSRDAFDYAKFI